MVVLLVLFGSWLILRAVGALGVTSLATWHDSVRYALALMFVFTGVAHFNKLRHDLARMIPSYFPQPMLIVYITGVFEFLGAAGLLIPRAADTDANLVHRPDLVGLKLETIHCLKPRRGGPT
ncbi:MAG TPA: DoxX family protein [Terriglobales bacterium]|nr:DoxX family protein [Terriglobales bacterium]